ncbi:MAG: hypothetical protein KC912_20155 [Proteobacteria bacterium]|nr:hypothetical protein [Pseudomonadota bacterium]
MQRFVLLALLASGCTRYDCAELDLFEDTFGEQCGPAGSQGSLYFEDEMAMLIIGAAIEDFLTEESSTIYDYVPTVVVGFRSVHLSEGSSLSSDQLSVTCGRSDEPFGVRQSWRGDGSLEVVEASNQTQTGGQSWRFQWDLNCPEQAQMAARGDDIIELSVTEFGYEFGLWGTPSDWPYL